jgi:TRAP-type mannitol/chloroaromatic compound transport system substrate-binding protein
MPKIRTTRPRKNVAAEKRSRREFLKAGAAAVVGATALSAPQIVRAQETITWRFQSTWPAKDIFHEFALDFAKRVNDMAAGALKIDVLPAGAVVKAFDLLDAVSTGTLDGGHGVLVYWYGKNPAVALWGSGPAFGMDANMLLAWHKYGGGKELLADIYKSLNLNVVSFPYGPMPTEPLGWYQKPIKSPDDFKGLKFRTVGLGIEMYTAMGAAVNALPGAEIVPALDRGLIDAAEFNNPSSDKALGFPDVAKIYMMQSFHQSAETFEILFNKAKYDALPDHLKNIISNAVEAASADMSWKAHDRYSKDYIDIQSQGKVKVYKTPNSMLQAQLKIWDEIIAKKSTAENPWFKKVLDSQKEFAKRVGGWKYDQEVDFRMAYNHYFRA